MCTHAFGLPLHWQVVSMSQYDVSECDAVERMIRWMGATPISTLEKHRTSVLIANKCVLADQANARFVRR